METIPALEAAARFGAARPLPPRRALGPIIVVAVYVLLVLSAPLLVRYGPFVP